MKKTLSLLLSASLVWASAGPNLLWAAPGVSAPVRGQASSSVSPLPGKLLFTPSNLHQAFLNLGPQERLEVLPAFVGYIQKNPQIFKKSSWKGYEEVQEILAGLSQDLEDPQPDSEKLREGTERLISALQKNASERIGNRDPYVPLETDADKLSFLLSLSERIPGIFKDAVTYDHDLFELLEKQRELQQKLEKMKSYRSLAQKQPPSLLKIEVLAGQNKKAVAKKLDPKVLEKWRAELDATLGILSSWQMEDESWWKTEDEPRQARANPALGPRPIVWEGGELDAPLKQALRKRVFSWTRFSINGFLTGLVNTLPPERRREVFKLPMEEKLKALENELPEELISKGFNPAPYGIEAERLEKKEALRLLESHLALQEEVRRLAEFYMLLENQDGNLPGSHWELEERIRRTGEAELDFFKDPIAFSEHFEKMLSSAGLGLDEKARENLLRLVQKHVKGIVSSTVETVSEITGSLLLEEVGPLVGIFRGFAGNDCSTQYSFPYPNSPMERVFFVYDASRRLKGYVAATLVKAGKKFITRTPSFKGERALYLHTINGKRISSSDVQLILGGLAQALGHFGAKAMVLPTRKMINVFVNSSEIESALNDQPLASGEAAADLRYLDNQVRRVLYEHMPEDPEYGRVNYDTAEVNTAGLKLDLKAQNGVSVQVQSVPPAPYVRKKISKEEAFWLAMDFELANRGAQAHRLMEAVKVDPERFAQIAGALENRPRRDLEYEFGISSDPDSLDEHLKSVNRAIKDSGLKITLEELRLRQPKFFYKGWFRAPDAMSEKWADKTIGYLKEIPEEEPYWQDAKGFIQNHPDQLVGQAEKLKGWVVSLFRNKKKEGKKFQVLRKTGILRLMKEEITAAVLSEKDPVSRLLRLLFLDEGVLSKKRNRSEEEKLNEAVVAGLETDWSSLPILDTIYFIRREKLAAPDIVSALKKKLNHPDQQVRQWALIALVQNGVREEGDAERLLEIVQSKEKWESSFYDKPILGLEAAKALKNFELSKEKIFPVFEKRYPEAFKYDFGLSLYGGREEELVALHLLLAVSDKDEQILKKIIRFAYQAYNPAAKIAAFVASLEGNLGLPNSGIALDHLMSGMKDISVETAVKLDAIESLGKLALINPQALQALKQLSQEVGSNPELKPTFEEAVGRIEIEAALNNVQVPSTVGGKLR